MRYDDGGRLERVDRPDGLRATFWWSTEQRLNQVVSPRGPTVFGYDDDTGQLATITDSEGDELAFEYDGSVPTAVEWSGEVAGRVEATVDGLTCPENFGPKGP